MQKKDFFPKSRHTLFVVCLVLCSFLLLNGCAFQQVSGGEAGKPACISQGWPQDVSDLPVDPQLIFGTLDNGIRYVIRQNKQPKERIALYLDVQAGSLNEEDDQRGLAHYLEHMLFNGTTNYPPGTLVEYFQTIGMGFGADTNAHTTYDETVYKLLLPAGDQETLNEGMEVLADYARGALLLEKEVDRERGIILAEKRARDSAQARVSKNLLKYEFAGTRIAERDPIGTEETLRSANSALLRSFYERWYRPENLIVVLVGDTDPNLAVQTIKRYFSGLSAGNEEVKCFDIGRVRGSGTDIAYQYEPDLGETDIRISTIWNIDPQPDTSAWEKIQLQNYVAASVLDNRLKYHVNEKDSALLNARVYAGNFLQNFGYFGLDARTAADKWQQGLAVLEQVLRQSVRKGITESELERVKREITADLEKKARTAHSRDSNELAMEIIRKINGNEVIVSPEKEKDLYGTMLAEMTVADVEQSLQRIWLEGRRVVQVAGTARLDGGEGSPEQQIRQVLANSSSVEVDAWQGEDTIEFPYLEPAQSPNAIAQVVDHEDIGATTTILANGLRINVKKTDFTEQEVLLAVHFGNGQLSEPVPGLSRLAEAVVYESGFGQMTREQLDNALAGRNGEVRFTVGPESFLFSGKGLSSELEFMLQLVYTGLADPAFRPDAYARSMKRFGQMYKSMQSSIEGTYQLYGQVIFAGGNSRYGFPDESTFLQLRLDQVREWIENAMQHADLEVSVVGDVDPEKVVALVREYLGGLQGTGTGMVENEPVRFPAGAQETLSVQTNDDKAVVAIGWPTDDFWDIWRTRRLSVLAGVLEDRMRQTIREELGAAYSPVAYNFASRADKGFGVLSSLLTVDPQQVDQVRDSIETITEDLRQHGVTAEELQRTLEPINTSIKDLQRTNKYWLESVLALSTRHPQQLEWPLSIRTDFASISPQQINDFAAKYLRREKEASLIIVPTGD